MNSKQLKLDKELIESINVDSGLSEWECNFIDSVWKRVTIDKIDLTEKQRETCLRIQRRLDERASEMWGDS